MIDTNVSRPLWFLKLTPTCFPRTSLRKLKIQYASITMTIASLNLPHAHPYWSDWDYSENQEYAYKGKFVSYAHVGTISNPPSCLIYIRKFKWFKSHAYNHEDIYIISIWVFNDKISHQFFNGWTLFKIISPYIKGYWSFKSHSSKILHSKKPTFVSHYKYVAFK